MKLLDRLFERSTRHVADTTSRRKFLGRLGSLMVAGAALPVLLPIRRPDASRWVPSSYGGSS